MRYFSLQAPPHPVNEGDEWHSPKGESPTFVRVRHGGEWKDAQVEQLESDNGEQQGSGSPSEHGNEGTGQVGSTGGAGELPPGNGDDGQVSGNAEGAGQQESAEVVPEGEGVDGNGSPVV